jgi:hypothetical protein
LALISENSNTRKGNKWQRKNQAYVLARRPCSVKNSAGSVYCGVGLSLFCCCWLLLPCVLLLLAAFALRQQSGGGQSVADGPRTVPEVGAVAPDFELVSYEGETMRLSDFRGRPVAVMFMHSW